MDGLQRLKTLQRSPRMEKTLQPFMRRDRIIQMLSMPHSSKIGLERGAGARRMLLNCWTAGNQVGRRRAVVVEDKGRTHIP